MSLACNYLSFKEGGNKPHKFFSKIVIGTKQYYSMNKERVKWKSRLKKAFGEIDSTAIDLKVTDNQADQPPEEIQLVQNSNRVQLFCLADPYTKFILSYRLSYEEEEMKSDQSSSLSDGFSKGV